LFIERCKYLRKTPYLDYFAGAQTRMGVQDSADYKRDRASNSLARPDRKIWYPSFFAKISHDGDQTADCYEGRNCGKCSQSDCRQAGQDLDSPNRWKVWVAGPPKLVDGHSGQDDQSD
jgi:hypothetical protein